MFDEMVSLLKQGEMVQSGLLRKRFDRALIKKLGVIKTPYSFWSSDKKINPSSKELLWAAILLNDTENYKIVEAVISSELAEKLRAKGMQKNIEALSNQASGLMRDYIAEFLELAPSGTFKKKLLQYVKIVTD